jgi:hypothetical protein
MSTTMISSHEEEIEALRSKLSQSRNAMNGLRLFELQRPEYVDIIALWRDLHEKK